MSTVNEGIFSLYSSSEPHCATLGKKQAEYETVFTPSLAFLVSCVRFRRKSSSIPLLDPIIVLLLLWGIVNNLFDVLNSSSKKGLTQYKSALTNDSTTIEFLNNCKEWVKSWQVISNKNGRDITSKFKFIDGLLLNISSCQALLKVLTEKHGFEYLCTRRLSTDPLENFFSILRGGYNPNLSSHQMALAFKHVTIN